MPVSQDELAAKLGPRLQARLHAGRQGYLDDARQLGPFKHFAAEAAFPFVEAWTPRLVTDALAEFRAEVGTWHINDLLDFFGHNLAATTTPGPALMAQPTPNPTDPQSQPPVGGSPAATELHQQLHQPIAEHVASKLESFALSRAPGASAVASPATAAALAAVPALVRLGLNLAVNAFGPTLEAVAVAERDTIKQFIAENTLDFLDRMIHDIEATAPQPQPQPTPAPAPTPAPGS